jgi:PadR family transcriptional regulator, regulatory protein PadR
MGKDFERVTPQLLKVLEALLDAPDQESHGWPLQTATGLGGPSVYRNLERCLEAGMVTSRWEDSTESGKPRRRLYKLTPTGAVRARTLLAQRGVRPVPRRLRPAGGVA